MCRSSSVLKFPPHLGPIWTKTKQKKIKRKKKNVKISALFLKITHSFVRTIEKKFLEKFENIYLQQSTEIIAT